MFSIKDGLKIKDTFEDNLRKVSWREFDRLSYEFLERNKDKLMMMYKLKERYNPTDMKKEFIKWCKYEQRPPVVELIHGRPYYIMEFFNSRIAGFNF